MNTGSLPIGTILHSPANDYRVEAVLGHGGFGITYRVSTKRSVKVEHVSQTVRLNFAVKEFFPKGCDRGGDGHSMTFATTLASEVKQSLTDFITEARRLYQLDTLSENIVKVNEVFEANGTAYYVMEYLDGGSVEDYVAQHGALSWDEARGILAPVAEAVAQLHKERLLHMDIKPDNIVFKLTDDDRRIPVLIDFGIAKHFDAAGRPTSHLAAKGASDGYAPVEQYVGITTFAPEIDIYALGATLYFMLTGHRPPSAAEIRYVDDLTSMLPPAATPAIPLLKRAMEPSRFSRLNSADDFASMLDAPAHIHKEEVPEPTAPNVDDNETLRLKDVQEAEEKAQAKEWKSVDKPTVIPQPASQEQAQGQKSTPSLNQPHAPSQKTSCEKRATSRERDILYVVLGLFILVFIPIFCVHQCSGSSDGYGSEAVEPYEEEITPNENNSLTFTVNGVTFYMMKVAGGTFTMGANEGDSEAFDDEKPQHEVTLSSYYIGQTEVTQALWEAVMGSNPSNFKGDNLPVERVSWNDCQTFISKLNAMTGQQFSLPTEAEWEFAARGGNKSRNYKYSGSNSIDAVAWYGSNSSSQTHAVGTKQANELGIYDMSGNVWEWCSDWYGSYSSSSQTNPTGPSSGSYRVERGGSWNDIAGVSRVSYRNDYTPTYRYSYLGLRLLIHNAR